MRAAPALIRRYVRPSTTRRSGTSSASPTSPAPVQTPNGHRGLHRIEAGDVDEVEGEKAVQDVEEQVCRLEHEQPANDAPAPQLAERAAKRTSRSERPRGN